MINPYPALPVDKNGNALQNYPAAKVALQRFTSENATVSSVISVTHNTTAIEVAAVGGAVAIKWIPTTDTEASIITIAGATSNYDHAVVTGEVRRFVIPIESQGTGNQSVVGVNRQNGLYRRIAYKSVGIASVMLTEYGF